MTETLYPMGTTLSFELIAKLRYDQHIASLGWTEAERLAIATDFLRHIAMPLNEDGYVDDVPEKRAVFTKILQPGIYEDSNDNFVWFGDESQFTEHDDVEQRRWASHYTLAYNLKRYDEPDFDSELNHRIAYTPGLLAQVFMDSFIPPIWHHSMPLSLFGDVDDDVERYTRIAWRVVDDYLAYITSDDVYEALRPSLYVLDIYAGYFGSGTLRGRFSTDNLSEFKDMLELLKMDENEFMTQHALMDAQANNDEPVLKAYKTRKWTAGDADPAGYALWVAPKGTMWATYDDQLDGYRQNELWLEPLEVASDAAEFVIELSQRGGDEEPARREDHINDVFMLESWGFSMRPITLEQAVAIENYDGDDLRVPELAQGTGTLTTPAYELDVPEFVK